MTEKPVFFRFQGDLHRHLITQGKRAENWEKSCQLFCVQSRKGLSVRIHDRKGMFSVSGATRAFGPLTPGPRKPRNDQYMPLTYSANEKFDSRYPWKASI